MRESFLDFLSNFQDHKKQPRKSLAYDDQKLRKIRALYGRRGTFMQSDCFLETLKNQNQDGTLTELEKI